MHSTVINSSIVRRLKRNQRQRGFSNFPSTRGLINARNDESWLTEATPSSIVAILEADVGDELVASIQQPSGAQAPSAGRQTGQPASDSGSLGPRRAPLYHWMEKG